MRLYEWEAKARLRAHGAPIPRGALARTLEEVASAVAEVGPPVVLKAQTLSGGRGKAGLVRHAETPADATSHARALFGAHHAGEVVDAVLVEARATVDRELFLAVTIDDVRGSPVLVCSRHGGVDVEEHAGAGEDTITVPIDVALGLRPHMVAPVATALGVRGKTLTSLAAVARTCWTTFTDSDASVVEVNPLGVLPDGSCLVLDAKVTIDDDALHRHPELADRPSDAVGLTEREERARRAGIRYTELGGTVAVLSGGAGMTMAIVDAIRHFGGSAANFVDVMGGIDASSARELAATALEQVETDPSIAALLVNLSLTASPIAAFVEGFEQAFRASPARVPVVGCVRGTGAAVLAMSLPEARSRIEALGVRLLPTLDEAIEEAVEIAAAAHAR